MKRNLKGERDRREHCSFERGRFLVGDRPVDVSPLLVTLILLKDGEIPSEDFGYVPKRTAETILRMSAFLKGHQRMNHKRKGAKA